MVLPVAYVVGVQHRFVSSVVAKGRIKRLRNLRHAHVESVPRNHNSIFGPGVE